MGRRYQRPPLVEAVCELRFANSVDQEWDLTLPGLLYQKIKDRFPVRRQRQSLQLPLTGPTPVTAPLAQFANSDQTLMVQAGPPGLLAVNSAKPHLGWSELRNTVLDVLAAYHQVSAPTALQFVAVRYINRIELPIRGLSLERYFQVLPGTPPDGPPNVSMFLVHTEGMYTEPAGRLRFRFGPTASESDTAAFMVDYEHSSLEVVPSFEDLPGWLDVAHERIDKAFYSTFTPTTHAEVFQEVLS